MRGTVMRTDVREAILDAVDRRLARFGYKRMTVEGLAEEAPARAPPLFAAADDAYADEDESAP